MPQQPLVQQNSRPETQLSETHRINSFAKNTYFKDLPPKKCRNCVQHANKYLFTSTFLIKSLSKSKQWEECRITLVTPQTLTWQHLCITACRCIDPHQHMTQGIRKPLRIDHLQPPKYRQYHNVHIYPIMSHKHLHAGLLIFSSVLQSVGAVLGLRSYHQAQELLRCQKQEHCSNGCCT